MQLHHLLTSFAFVATLAHAAAADPQEVRIATLAPNGSSWMKVLDKGAADVAAKSQQRVQFKYFAGGVQGDERDVVRKINLGQLEGAVVTSIGLSMVDESIRVLELPRMFATVEELDYVADKMWPYFQKKFEAKGYRLEDRGEVGWTYFFSNAEIKAPDSLTSQKLWLWGDDAIMHQLYKVLGVSGVPLGVPEVEPALTNGRINAVYASPLAAVAFKWNTKVKYMMTMPIAFAIGGTIIKLDAIKKMSKADQELIAKIDREVAVTSRHQIRKDDEAAKKQMVRNGLKVTETSAETLAAFDKAAQHVTKDLTGKLFSKEELAMVMKYRDEYRAKTAK